MFIHGAGKNEVAFKFNHMKPPYKQLAFKPTIKKEDFEAGTGAVETIEYAETRDPNTFFLALFTIH